MHARSTTINGDPSSVDAGIAFVHEETMPTLRGMDGCAGLSMLVDRTSGRAIVTTSWRDEQALRASRDAVRPTLERTAEVLGGPAEVEEWSIAAMHRLHEAHHGVCARVTWLRTAGDSVARAVAAARPSLMPKLDDLPGFSSLSAMVQPDAGL